MANVIVALSIISILALAVYKLIAMKRKGGACAGCAERGSCTKK